MLEKIVSKVNEIVWNPALVGLLIVAGLYFSFRTRFVQVRRFKLMLRSLFSRQSPEKGISSFEAFCIALSGRVGTGNIVGATKIPHFDAAVRAVDLTLSPEDIAFLEAPYKPHRIVGALTPTDSTEIQVK